MHTAMSGAVCSVMSLQVQHVEDFIQQRFVPLLHGADCKVLTTATCSS